MPSLKELIVKIGADTSGLTGGVNDAKNSLAGLQVAGEGLVSVGAALSASVTAPIVALGMAAVTAGGQMEQSRIAFETMLGSAEASASFLKDLENFAKSTPFEFDGLVTSSKQMLAFGFAAADIIPNLTAVGDAIAAVGGGEEAIQGVIRALGQMAQKGKVSAEEINQMAERGIGAWKYLASEAGVSIAEVQKLAEKGALDAGVAIRTIIEGMGNEFGGLMSKQSQTLMGQISNLQDTFGQSLTRLGEALIPFANQAVGLAAQMAEAFSAAVDVFAGLPEPVQSAVVAIAGLAAAVGPLVAGVGGLMVAWGALGPSITAAGATMAAVATGPVGITVAAIAAATAAYYAFGDQLTFLDPILSAIGGAFDALSSAASAVAANWTPLVAGIAAFAQEVYAAIPGLSTMVDWIGPKLMGALSGIGSVIQSVVIVHLEAMGAVFGWLAEKAESLFGYFVDKGKKALGDTGKEFKATAADGNELRKTLDTMAASAKSAEPEIKKPAAAALVLGTNAKKAKQDVFDLDKSLRALEATNREAERIAKAAAKALADEMSPAAVDLKLDVDAVSTATQLAMNNIATWTRTAADGWDNAAMQAATRTAEIEAAFSSMGLKTKAELEQAATDAAHNFDLIAGSGQASASAIDAAWVQMLKARKEALTANGLDLGVEEQRILDDLLAKQKTHTTDSKTAWNTWADGIKGVFNNLNLGDKIFSGGFKPENIKSTLKGIGDDFLNAFAQPAKDAINGLIDQGINVLMGSLDGLIGKLGGVGGAFSSAFGGGVPGGGGGAGGGASSGAASAAGGAMGVVSAVTGVVTAGSSIWGNFQNMEIESGIDAIELETRQLKELVRDQVLPDLWFKSDMMQFGPAVKLAEQLIAHVSGPQFGILGAIMEATSWGPGVKAAERSAEELAGLRSDIYALMARLEQVINRPISIQVDGRELAQIVGANQEALGVTA